MPQNQGEKGGVLSLKDSVKSPVLKEIEKAALELDLAPVPGNPIKPTRNHGGLQVEECLLIRKDQNR